MCSDHGGTSVSLIDCTELAIAVTKPSDNPQPHIRQPLPRLRGCLIRICRPVLEIVAALRSLPHPLVVSLVVRGDSCTMAGSSTTYRVLALRIPLSSLCLWHTAVA